MELINLHSRIMQISLFWTVVHRHQYQSISRPFVGPGSRRSPPRLPNAGWELYRSYKGCISFSMCRFHFIISFFMFSYTFREMYFKIYFRMTSFKVNFKKSIHTNLLHSMCIAVIHTSPLFIQLTLRCILIIK